MPASETVKRWTAMAPVSNGDGHKQLVERTVVLLSDYLKAEARIRALEECAKELARELNAWEEWAGPSCGGQNALDGAKTQGILINKKEQFGEGATGEGK